jgi:hypothetical protein
MKIDTEKSENSTPAAHDRIRLDLSRHCIQTATRRCYEKTLTECLRSKRENHDLERRVDLLRQALETLDFSLLRSRWPELAGECTASIGLSRDARRIFIHIDNRRFPAPLRKDAASKGTEANLRANPGRPDSAF